MTPDELRQWRVQRGLTQADLAALLELSPLTVLRWENGQQAISPLLEPALRYYASRLDAPPVSNSNAS